MRKILLTIFAILIVFGAFQPTQASLVSDKSYRREQIKETKQDIKAIKSLFEAHEQAANKHDLKALSGFYSDKYTNNDGFNKDVYMKSVESTWDACHDLTYSTKILAISVDGDFASVNVEEKASGTVMETSDFMQVAGEIHSLSGGIYYLEKVNGKWYISGENAIMDESSLLYGDARFMNIELQSPAQVNSGEDYTATVKVDADDKTFIMGSIVSDKVVYPTATPKAELRPLPQTQILERIVRANSDNLNEYVVASLAISKVKSDSVEDFKVYLAGLACVMKRVNVVPKNNFIKIED
jgi:ketosteroid isomerase-like protein